MGCFATADGYVNIGAAGGRILRAFAEVIGLPELPADPRFDTPQKRFANRAELARIVSDRLRTQGTDYWVTALNAAGVPCGPVYAMDEVFADPQVQHLEMAQAVDHPARGRIDLVRNAVRMTGAAGTVRAPAPDPGDHTDDVLTDLGYAPAEIEKLRADRVI
jgi:crotonobetainyl-CoA:carnitine CoA-transferase CaiB-like acyl-CoA transferase